MTEVYGKDFAQVYNDTWPNFGLRMWPLLAGEVARRCPAARTWLDLCCGTGSLLQILGEQGYAATGVDRSPHQLAHARRNAPGATLVEADVREFSLPGDFDVVTSLFDSLNYLTIKRDLERVFRRARRHLAEGGLFIFDMNTFAGLQDHWCRASVVRKPDRVTCTETSFDAKTALGHWRLTGFVPEGALYRRFEEHHVQRGYTPEEIEDLLTRAGFGFRKYDGDSHGRPRRRSGRLVYVCRHT